MRVVYYGIKGQKWGTGRDHKNDSNVNSTSVTKLKL